MVIRKPLTIIASIGILFLTAQDAFAPVYHAEGLYNRPAVPVSMPPVPVSRDGIENASTWTITAYTAGVESTGKSPSDSDYGIAADGKQIEKGEVACDRHYSFGTRFDIAGMGVYTCADRGGAITGHHLDVFMPRLRDAIDFGRQQKEVEILYETSTSSR